MNPGARSARAYKGEIPSINLIRPIEDVQYGPIPVNPIAEKQNVPPKNEQNDAKTEKTYPQPPPQQQPSQPFAQQPQNNSKGPIEYPYLPPKGSSSASVSRSPSDLAQQPYEHQQTPPRIEYPHVPYFNSEYKYGYHPHSTAQGYTPQTEPTGYNQPTGYTQPPIEYNQPLGYPQLPPQIPSYQNPSYPYGSNPPHSSYRPHASTSTYYPHSPSSSIPSENYDPSYANHIDSEPKKGKEKRSLVCKAKQLGEKIIGSPYIKNGKYLWSSKSEAESKIAELDSEIAALEYRMHHSHLERDITIVHTQLEQLVRERELIRNYLRCNPTKFFRS